MRSPIIKKHAVHLEPRTLPVGKGAPRQSGGGHGEPAVRIVRQGELIESIEIVCPCGHEMVLDCIYDQAANQGRGGDSRAAPRRS